jgi:hypothetical protein
MTTLSNIESALYLCVQEDQGFEVGDENVDAGRRLALG